MLLLLGLLFTYVAAPLAVFGVAARFVKADDDIIGRLFLLTAGIAPLAIAWLLWCQLLVFPGRSLVLYAGVIVIAVAGTMFVGRREIAGLLRSVPRYLPILADPWRKGTFGLRLLWLLAIALVVITIIQALSIPVLENDTAEYALISKYILSERTMAVYPVAQAHPGTGLYANASHPPSFHMMLGWSYLFGGFDNSRAMRFINLFYFAISAMMLSDIARRFIQSGGLQVVILLLLAPFYVSLIVGFHVDPARLCTSLAALLLAAIVIERRGDIRWTGLCGVVTGFSLFSHSIGILTLGFVGLALLLFLAVPLKDRIRAIAIMTVIALLIGGWQYIFNIIQFGVPLQDNEPVMADPALNFTEDLRYRRDLTTSPQRLVYGVFQLFSRLELVSIFGWVALFSAIALRRAIWARMDLRVLAMSVIVFLILSLATALAGLDFMVKNIRYAMTVAFPMVAIAACGLGYFFLHTRSRLFRSCAVLLLLVMSGPVLLHSAYRLRNLAAPTAIWLGEEWQVLMKPRFPGGGVLLWAREHVNPEERVLTFRQPDYAYYVGTPWIRDIDPTLLHIYHAQTVQEAHRMLRERNVRYVFLPNYMWPTLYNTQIMRLIGDPAYSTKVAEHQGYSMYRLHDVPANFACKPVPATELLGLWKSNGSLLMGLIGLGEVLDQPQKLLAHGSHKLPFHVKWDPVVSLRIPHQFLIYGREHPTLRSRQGIEVPTDGGLLSVTIRMRGKAIIYASLEELSAEDRVSTQALGDLVVRPEGSVLHAQAHLRPGTSEIALMLRSGGRAGGDLSLEGVAMCLMSDTSSQTHEKWKPHTIVGSYPLHADSNYDKYWTRPYEPGSLERNIQSSLYLIDHTDAKESQILQFVSEYFRDFRPAPASDWVNHELIVAGKSTATGSLEVYVNWRDASGKLKHRYVGDLFWGEDSTERSMRFKLPKEANDLGVFIIKTLITGERIELDSVTIRR